jgi:hypothetical protein
MRNKFSQGNISPAVSLYYDCFNMNPYLLSHPHSKRWLQTQVHPPLSLARFWLQVHSTSISVIWVAASNPPRVSPLYSNLPAAIHSRRRNISHQQRGSIGALSSLLLKSRACGPTFRLFRVRMCAHTSFISSALQYVSREFNCCKKIPDALYIRASNLIAIVRGVLWQLISKLL